MGWGASVECTLERCSHLLLQTECDEVKRAGRTDSPVDGGEVFGLEVTAESLLERGWLRMLQARAAWPRLRISRSPSRRSAGRQYNAVGNRNPTIQLAGPPSEGIQEGQVPYKGRPGCQLGGRTDSREGSSKYC